MSALDCTFGYLCHLPFPLGISLLQAYKMEYPPELLATEVRYAYVSLQRIDITSLEMEEASAQLTSVPAFPASISSTPAPVSSPPDASCSPQRQDSTPPQRPDSPPPQQRPPTTEVVPTPSSSSTRILGSCTYCAEPWTAVYSRPNGRAVTNNTRVCKEKLHVMCDRCFGTHFALALQQNQPPTCPICRAEIKELFDVTTQMQEAHPPENGKTRNRKRPTTMKPTGMIAADANTCSCGATFTHRGSLSRHRKRHLALRPHVCELCGKDFVDKNHLDRHMKQGH